MAFKRLFNVKDGHYALLLGCIHFVVAVFDVLVRGVSIVIDPQRSTWDWFWQSVPVELLRTDLLRSIWNLHAQPPLYNLFIGVLVKLFFPNHLPVLHATNILLGTLLSGMIYMIIVQLLPHRLLAFGLALIIAMSPSIFLYEAYMLYSLLCAFLVVLNVFCLSWYNTTKSTGALYGFIGSLTILVLTRSLYYVLFLLVALIFISFLIKPENRRRALIISSVICAIAFGWCIKNYLTYGFFGTSSWYGMGLWNIAAYGYTHDELRSLADDGVLDPMVVAVGSFSVPSMYQPYGFNKSSSEDLLSKDDMRNVNIPDISRVYGNNANRLIMQQPLRYAQSVYEAYRIFCRPSSRFKHLPFNLAKIEPHEAFYAVILQGRTLMSQGATDYGSFLFFLLPTALMVYMIQLLLRLKAGDSPGAIIRSDAIMVWCFFLIAYVTLLACAAEFGEQDRFKFDVEQIMWIFIPVVFFRLLQHVVTYARRRLNR